MHYPAKAEVLQANQGITSSAGQSSAVMAEANLDHYLSQVHHYAETIPDSKERLLKKAAYLLYHLAYDAHVFSDGNKRTALVVVWSFLQANGYAVPAGDAVQQEEIVQLMKEIAQGRRSINSIYAWFEKTVISLHFENRDI